MGPVVVAGGGEDGVLVQHRPVKSVRRDQAAERPGRVEPGREADGLVALRLGRRRVAVLEDTHVLGRTSVDHDVVVSGRFEPADAPGFMDPQDRPFPMDAVAALGVTGARLRPPIGPDSVPYAASPVPEPVAVSLRHVDRGVTQGALPGAVELEDHLPGYGAVQLQLHPLHGLDQPVVHEQLELGPDLTHLRG